MVVVLFPIKEQPQTVGQVCEERSADVHIQRNALFCACK